MAEDPSAIDRAVALHGDALAALDDGDLPRAKACAVEALAMFERESGATHPDVANVLNCLARVEGALLNYAEASRHAARSVEVMRAVRQRADGADIERLYVQSLTAHGNVERILGRYDSAERLLREALTAADGALEEGDEDLVRTLNSLGVLFKYSGRFDEAKILYERAIRMVERVSGPDQDSLATLLHNLGGLEHARGDY